MSSNIARGVAQKLENQMKSKIRSNEYSLALRNYTAGFRGQGAKQMAVSNLPSVGQYIVGRTLGGTVSK